MEMTIIFFVIAATLTAAALLGRSRRRRRGFAGSHEDPYAYARRPARWPRLSSQRYVSA
jgi:hypothetical protein